MCCIHVNLTRVLYNNHNLIGHAYMYVQCHVHEEMYAIVLCSVTLWLYMCSANYYKDSWLTPHPIDTVTC